MSDKEPLNPNTIATIALELTKAIASVESQSNHIRKHEDPKEFYFEVYEECYHYVRQISLE